ncbi:Crp/Fnr family transcriptional regulator [Flavobacterium sp. CSZ]|uniref:Crp/Fnr family transcriptional regulator n=1 Tax=Flavobacterium sp. CSZ TaxID=2783791 RepID=UPI00188DC48D|nr:Crp/Fnr family transcriptional regulator [Flavobacterium sp. CSZ]MBF4485736.1 Crp/Fnr family transcriptional regulator [Flavobacterium sp. CSZ]
MKHNQNDWSVSLRKKYPIVSTEEWKLLDQMTILKKINKGENFLSYGRIARYAAFVISGKFAFSIFDDEGNEKIIRFAFADDFLANCESYYQKKGSAITITALEDSVIRRINIKTLSPLYDLHMSLSRVNLQIFQEIAEKDLEHQYILSLKSPVKRYKFLLKHRPAIIRKISITSIAKYLYVSREALSRARVSLVKKQLFCD